MAVPHTFANGEVIDANEVNENFAVFADIFPATGGDISGHITPATTNTYDLGSSTKLWRKVYTYVLGLADSNASHILSVIAGSNITANRTLTINTGDANRALTLAGDATISGTNTGDQYGSTTASRLLGRGSASGAGAAQEITPGTGLTMDGTTLNASVPDLSSLDADNLDSGTVPYARLPAGSPLQLPVTATTITPATSSSGTYGDTGLTANITTTVANSKVLVTVHQSLGSDTATTVAMELYRGGSLSTIVASGSPVNPAHVSSSYIDTPGTVGTYTYKTRYKVASGGGSVYAQLDAARSTIVLQELQP